MVNFKLTMTETQTHFHDKEVPIEDPMAAFMERVRQHSETFGSKLKELFKAEGNSEKFREELDDVVYDIAFEIPEYVENTKRLKSGLGGKNAEMIAAGQRQIANEIRRLVLIEAGIGTTEAGSDIQIARDTVARRLEGYDMDSIRSDEILRQLGILHEDEGGGATFTYPEDLFPESVNEKWKLYIDSVARHIDMGNKVRKGEEEQVMLGEADRARRFAHNAIASDIHEILGLDQLSDEVWSFESTRRLVAKMREEKFIGQPTSESEITARALRQSIGAAVLSRLSDRTNPIKR